VTALTRFISDAPTATDTANTSATVIPRATGTHGHGISRMRRGARSPSWAASQNRRDIDANEDPVCDCYGRSERRQNPHNPGLRPERPGVPVENNDNPGFRLVPTTRSSVLAPGVSTYRFAGTDGYTTKGKLWESALESRCWWWAPS
jgi:hypothetical protein